MATVQANSWGRRRRSHRSKVLNPNASATMAEAVAKAVFKVTVKNSTGGPVKFVKEVATQ
jgi:hypothetical protein